MNHERDKVARVKEAILCADKNSSLKEIVDIDPLAFKGIRMLYSTNASGAILQVEGKARDVFTGIFSKDRLLAYSDSIRAEMESGNSTICYIQRALFDTNLISGLPKFFTGEELSTRSHISDILSVITTEYGGGFDYSFTMLENLRQFTSCNNPHPVHKVAAAIYFDHLIRGKIESHSDEDNIFEPYFEQSETKWSNFRVDKHMWRQVDRRDVIYAILLKTYHMCWTINQITIESALHDLIDYCLSELGIVPLKELYFCWKVIAGFSVGYFAPVFDEKPLKSPKKKSVDRISALAWDLFIFRFVETLLTEEKGNKFYIPIITTLDKGLLDTIAECPVRAMISFPEIGYVETIFEDELLFQQCLHTAMSVKQKEKILASDRSIKGEKKLRHYVSLSIYDLEKKINGLVPSQQ